MTEEVFINLWERFKRQGGTGDNMVEVVWSVFFRCLKKRKFTTNLRHASPAHINPVLQHIKPARCHCNLRQILDLSVNVDEKITLRGIQSGYQPLQNAEFIMRDDEPGVVHFEQVVGPSMPEE